MCAADVVVSSAARGDQFAATPNTAVYFVVDYECAHTREFIHSRMPFYSIIFSNIRAIVSANINIFNRGCLHLWCVVCALR